MDVDPIDMRRIAPLLLLLLLSLGFARADGLAGGALRVVPLHALRPSQMSVGRAEVDSTLHAWEVKAAKLGLSLREYTQKKLVPQFGSLALEAIVDPEGHVRPTDGHHRISALLEIAKRTGIAVNVQVKIATDYRGETLESYANDFLQVRRKGAFTRGVLRLAPVERLKYLPDGFKALGNSPMRSSVARLFTKLGFDDMTMVDYAEFRVGDWLADHGLFRALAGAGIVKPHTTTLPNALIEDPRVLAVMQHTLETDDGVRFLTRLAPGHERQVENRLLHRTR